MSKKNAYFVQLKAAGLFIAYGNKRKKESGVYVRRCFQENSFAL
jgi:hypothetical protein